MSIHVHDGYIKKIQILFPEPQMKRLRDAARREDRPLSEIFRRATEEYLRKLPGDSAAPQPASLPSFEGGRTLVGPEDFRELAYRERTEPRADHLDAGR